MDLAKYWRTVRSIEKTLPGSPGEPVFLVSVANDLTGTQEGKVSSADREYAARWIAQGSHRVATEEEIGRYHAEIRGRTEAIHKAELEKKQTVRLESVIPQEQLDAAVQKALEGAKPSKTKEKN